MNTNRFKFRVWDTKLKKFVTAFPGVKAWLDADEWDDSEQLEGHVYIYPENVTPSFGGRMIWQQFTGLTDLNGKDLYEGDLVKYCINDDPEDLQWEVWEVYYSKNKMAWYVGNDPGEGIDWDGDFLYEFCHNTGSTYLEIIGNVLENLELIK